MTLFTVVAINYGEIDDYYTVAKMIVNRIPLDEPYMQYRLSILEKVEKNRTERRQNSY